MKFFLIRDAMSPRLRRMMKLDKIILLRVGVYFGFQLRERMPHPKFIGLSTQTEVNIRSHYAKMFVSVLDQLRLLPHCLKARLGVDLAVLIKPCTSETLFYHSSAILLGRTKS